MFEVLNQLAYVAFHCVVWGSFTLGKIFYPKMRLPNLKKLVAIVPVSLIFIICDFLVANRWWYFSDQYTIFKIGPLPIEEIFFFISIPYALIVITENLQSFFSTEKSYKIPPIFYYLIVSLISLLTVVTLLKQWEYTAIVLLLLLFSLHKNQLENKVFLYGFLITIFSTFIFNLYLTALPIVTYNPVFKSQIHILSIPIEDFIYGILLYIYSFKRYYGSTIIHH